MFLSDTNKFQDIIEFASKTKKDIKQNKEAKNISDFFDSATSRYTTTIKNQIKKLVVDSAGKDLNIGRILTPYLKLMWYESLHEGLFSQPKPKDTDKLKGISFTNKLDRGAFTNKLDRGAFTRNIDYSNNFNSSNKPHTFRFLYNHSVKSNPRFNHSFKSNFNHSFKSDPRFNTSFKSNSIFEFQSNLEFATENSDISKTLLSRLNGAEPTPLQNRLLNVINKNNNPPAGIVLLLRDFDKLDNLGKGQQEDVLTALEREPGVYSSRELDLIYDSVKGSQKARVTTATKNIGGYTPLSSPKGKKAAASLQTDRSRLKGELKELRLNKREKEVLKEFDNLPEEQQQTKILEMFTNDPNSELTQAFKKRGEISTKAKQLKQSTTKLRERDIPLVANVTDTKSSTKGRKGKKDGPSVKQLLEEESYEEVRELWEIDALSDREKNIVNRHIKKIYNIEDIVKDDRLSKAQKDEALSILLKKEVNSDDYTNMKPFPIRGRMVSEIEDIETSKRKYIQGIRDKQNLEITVSDRKSLLTGEDIGKRDRLTRPRVLSKDLDVLPKDSDTTKDELITIRNSNLSEKEKIAAIRRLNSPLNRDSDETTEPAKRLDRREIRSFLRGDENSLETLSTSLQQNRTLTTKRYRSKDTQGYLQRLLGSPIAPEAAAKNRREVMQRGADIDIRERIRDIQTYYPYLVNEEDRFNDASKYLEARTLELSRFYEEDFKLAIKEKVAALYKDPANKNLNAKQRQNKVKEIVEIMEAAEGDPQEKARYSGLAQRLRSAFNTKSKDFTEKEKYDAILVAEKAERVWNRVNARLNPDVKGLNKQEVEVKRREAEEYKKRIEDNDKLRGYLEQNEKLIREVDELRSSGASKEEIREVRFERAALLEKKIVPLIGYEGPLREDLVKEATKQWLNSPENADLDPDLFFVDNAPSKPGASKSNKKAGSFLIDQSEYRKLKKGLFLDNKVQKESRTIPITELPVNLVRELEAEGLIKSGQKTISRKGVDEVVANLNKKKLDVATYGLTQDIKNRRYLYKEAAKIRKRAKRSGGDPASVDKRIEEEMTALAETNKIPINELQVISQDKGLFSIATNPYTRLDRIINSEVTTAYNLGRLEAFTRNGVQQVRWVSRLDTKTSTFCTSLNNRIFNLNEIMAFSTGRGLVFPYFPKTRESFDTMKSQSVVGVFYVPSVHPYCRSYLEPVPPQEELTDENKALFSPYQQALSNRLESNEIQPEGLINNQRLLQAMVILGAVSLNVKARSDRKKREEERKRLVVTTGTVLATGVALYAFSRSKIAHDIWESSKKRIKAGEKAIPDDTAPQRVLTAVNDSVQDVVSGTKVPASQIDELIPKPTATPIDELQSLPDLSTLKRTRPPLEIPEYNPASPELVPIPDWRLSQESQDLLSELKIPQESLGNTFKEVIRRGGDSKSLILRLLRDKYSSADQFEESIQLLTKRFFSDNLEANRPVTGITYIEDSIYKVLQGKKATLVESPLIPTKLEEYKSTLKGQVDEARQALLSLVPEEVIQQRRALLTTDIEDLKKLRQSYLGRISAYKGQLGGEVDSRAIKKKIADEKLKLEQVSRDLRRNESLLGTTDDATFLSRLGIENIQNSSLLDQATKLEIQSFNLYDKKLKKITKLLDVPLTKADLKKAANIAQNRDKYVAQTRDRNNNPITLSVDRLIGSQGGISSNAKKYVGKLSSNYEKEEYLRFFLREDLLKGASYRYINRIIETYKEVTTLGNPSNDFITAKIREIQELSESGLQLLKERGDNLYAEFYSYRPIVPRSESVINAERKRLLTNLDNNRTDLSDIANKYIAQLQGLVK